MSTLTIRYIATDGGPSEEDWSGSLEDAKALAEKSVKLGTCLRVEIRDQDGKALFHFPRITRAASPKR